MIFQFACVGYGAKWIKQKWKRYKIFYFLKSKLIYWHHAMIPIILQQKILHTMLFGTQNTI